MNYAEDMTEDDAFHAKEALSWQTAACILAIVGEPLQLMILHPGSGLYDCLSLVEPHGRVRIMMNRSGDAADVDGRTVSGIWDVASGPDGPSRLAHQLIDMTDVPIINSVTVGSGGTMATSVGTWLRSGRTRSAKACWQDIAGFEPTRDVELLSFFRVPPEWLRQTEPISGTDPSAWLFVLTDQELPVALLNAADGQAVNRVGARWEGLAHTS